MKYLYYLLIFTAVLLTNIFIPNSIFGLISLVLGSILIVLLFI